MKFSIIIPLAPERDAPILNSIREIDYPKSEFHVVVVRGKNPSENRNKGFEKSKGEILAFLDDDAEVDKEILKNAEIFFDEHPNIDIVGGPQLTPLNDKGFAKISGYALSSFFGAWKLAKRYDRKKEDLDVDESSITSANLFCREKVLEKIKFDTALFPGEDPKFISDAKKEGFSVAYSPNIIIYHKRRTTLRKLVKQIFSYGKVRPKKESFIETVKRPYFFIPSLFLLYLLILLVSILLNPTITGNAINFNREFTSGWILYPLFVYFCLALVFGVYDSIKNRDFMALFLLPFIYLVIHISYGAGMIWGYFKK